MERVIMLGDSLIDWNYNSPYENYGKNGYRSRDVFWLLEENSNITGDIGILLVGVNDFFTNMDFEKSQEYYMKIVVELKKRVKRVILLSLLPTDRKYINEKVKLFNSWIKQSYPKEYLELYSFFCDEYHEMKRRYTTDGTHLNHEGYKLFNKILDEEVMKIKKLYKENNL